MRDGHVMKGIELRMFFISWCRDFDVFLRGRTEIEMNDLAVTLSMAAVVRELLKSSASF